jgi:hypothetical protein
MLPLLIKRKQKSMMYLKRYNHPLTLLVETTKPPFPEHLSLTKMPEPPAFNLLGELQNLYVKIPLLQAL